MVNLIIPNGIVDIPESAYRGRTVLSCVVIPDGVQTIGSYAFANCTDFQSVVIE